MADVNRIAGAVEFAYNGNVVKVIGNMQTNLGRPIREVLVGPDSVHGYKEMPQAPFIEGEARVVSGFKVKDFVDATNVTATLQLANGSLYQITDGWFEGEGTFGSEDANLPFKFCGLNAEELVAS
jgi:hypothetical protein